LKFVDLGFCGKRETGEPEEKLLEQNENQQQTQTMGRNQTWATLVRGKRPHHRAIPAHH